jgi:hypothetical protein
VVRPRHDCHPQGNALSRRPLRPLQVPAHVLSPAAGASFFKKALLGLAGLILLAAAYFEER